MKLINDANYGSFTAPKTTAIVMNLIYDDDGGIIEIGGQKFK